MQDQFWSCTGPVILAYLISHLPEILPHSTYKLPMVSPLPESQPHSVLSLGCKFDSKQLHSAFVGVTSPCILRETFSGGPPTLPQATVFLEQIPVSVGPKQEVADLAAI